MPALGFTRRDARSASASWLNTLFDSIDSSPLGAPSGVIYFEATIRQHLTRSRSPGVILFEATRQKSVDALIDSFSLMELSLHNYRLGRRQFHTACQTYAS
jgi:hypothetical protein